MIHSETRPENTSSGIPDFIDRAPSVIGGIITDYLVFSVTDASEQKAITPEQEKKCTLFPFSWKMNTKLGLFNNFGLRRIAEELVSGNVDAAIRGIVQMRDKCPTLMHEICEITDHRGRRLRGTLLQFAAMNFDFNPHTEMKKPYGAAERLIALDLLSEKEVKKQLNEAGFDPDSKDDFMTPDGRAKTDARTDKRKVAIRQLFNDIVALDINDNADWNLMRIQAKTNVQAFWASLEEDGVITQGLVFDPEILVWCIEHLCENKGQPAWQAQLGGQLSIKSELLWAVGFGSLQASDSAAGIQCYRQGLKNVVYTMKIPERAVPFSSGPPNVYTRLGSSSCLSLFDGVERRGKDRLGGQAGGYTVLVEDILEDKKNSLIKLYADLRGTDRIGPAV